MDIPNRTSNDVSNGKINGVSVGTAAAGVKPNSNPYLEMQCENTEAVSIIKDVNFYIVMTDRSKLPDQLKNFKKLSVMGLFQISQYDIYRGLKDQIKNGYGIEDYDEDFGYSSANDTAYDVISFYDGDKNLLGYMFIKK